MDNILETHTIASLYKHGKNLSIELEGLLSSACFKDNTCQVLYKIISSCIDDELDLDKTSLIAMATKLGVSDFFNKNHKSIEDILNIDVSLNNGIVYGKKLYKVKTIDAGKRLLKKSYDELAKLDENCSVDDILRNIENPSYEILQNLHETRDDRPVNLGEYAEEYIEEKIANPIDMVGIPTPFPKFNRAIGGGMRKGGITLVCAPTGNGKSLFAKEVITFLSKTIPVLYIDTEMNKGEQVDRTIASMSGVPIEKVETGHMSQEEINRVREAYRLLKRQNFYHRNVASMEFEEIMSVIKRWIYQTVGINAEGHANDCLVVYDYFKIMSVKEVEAIKEYEAIGYNATRLTDFAENLNFAVLSFVQLNGNGEIAQAKRLEWYVKSASLLFKKTEEEIAEFPNGGNGKLITNRLKQRFNQNAMQLGDYINLHVDPTTSTMSEGQTYFELKSQVQESGFEDEEEEDDEDFFG